MIRICEGHGNGRKIERELKPLFDSGWIGSSEEEVAQKYAELYQKAMNRLRNRQAGDPEAIFHETLLKLRDRKVPIAEPTFNIMFYQILNGKHIDAVRRLKVREKYDSMWQADCGDQEDPIMLGMEREELRAALKKGMKRLPKKQRIALHLRFFKNCSIREIAVRMRQGVEATKAQLHRALKKLRSYLERTESFRQIIA